MIGDITIFIIGMILAFEVESSTDKVLSNLGQTLKQNRSWHKSDALNLGIVSALIIYYMLGVTLQSILALTYIGLLRMTYFNIRLNMKRGKPILYLGKNGWDGLFKKRTKLYYGVAFLLLAINVITLYFYDVIF